MKKIVLLRHGESAWNKENRFTGWTDVDLTEKGVAEAVRAGELLAEKGISLQEGVYFLSEACREDTGLCAGPPRPGLDSGGEIVEVE